MIINAFYSDNSNIAETKLKHPQIMTTIVNGILKLKPTIVK